MNWKCEMAIIYSVAVVVSALAESAHGTSKAEKWLEQVRSKEQSIVFYGKVIDQNGDPVIGAKVLLSLNKVTLMPKGQEVLESTTDQRGCFKVSDMKGSGLYIKNLKLPGYEVVSQDDNRYFNYRKDRKPLHVPDKSKPIIFRMRKKSLVSTFLIQRQYIDFKFWKSVMVYEYDFIQGKKRQRQNIGTEHVADGGCQYDLTIEGEYDADASKWQVEFTPVGTNAGIVESNEFLSEAPASGYRTSCILHLEDHKLPEEKYLYLRSRRGGVWTRIEIYYVSCIASEARISIRYWTNPYGDRNLEAATDVPFEVSKQLIEEAKSAHRQGKRPKKPDLKALIKAEKEKSSSRRHSG